MGRQRLQEETADLADGADEIQEITHCRIRVNRCFIRGFLCRFLLSDPRYSRNPRSLLLWLRRSRAGIAWSNSERR